MPQPLLLLLHQYHPSSSRFHHCRFSLFFPNLKPPKPMSRSHSLSSTPNQTPPQPSSSTVDLDHHDHDDRDQKLSQVLRYHSATKHGFTRYARGPHGLDWANQPNPFRRYLNAPLVPLLHSPTPNQNPNPNPNPDPDQSSLLYSSVFLSLPSPSPLSKPSISQLFYDSLALSAWKSTGFSTWSLRVNPSSGNLHPTEAYIVSPPIESVSESGFVAHYAPKEHALEVRAEVSPRSRLFELIPENGFLIGLSSIFWREAWKYGERAFRYCNHDVGHAIAAVAVAAAGIGFDVKVLDGLGHGDLEKLMGLDQFAEFRVPSRPVKGKLPEIEFEHPDCVLAVFPSGIRGFDVNYEELSNAILEFSNLEWKGEPNSLSKEHVCWDVIYRTSEAVKKPRDVVDRFVVEPFQSSGLFSENAYKGLAVREIVRKRRSAVDMDGVTVMERDTFYQILLHCLPSGFGDGERQRRPLALPFRALPWDAEVHAALFVHRVEGLHQGLYFLVRNEEHFGELKRSMRPEFNWTKPEGCPDELPLYELDRGDYQHLSQRLSCHQEIASNGCFSLGMIAHFEPVLREKVWMYPPLFWETGVLGQVLYLEAHAVGISATGIGCYFDDPVHEVLGLKESNFQSLYHFTVGGPVVDKRIMSLPAYPGPNVDA